MMSIGMRVHAFHHLSGLGSVMCGGHCGQPESVLVLGAIFCDQLPSAWPRKDHFGALRGVGHLPRDDKSEAVLRWELRSHVFHPSSPFFRPPYS